jgi:hypothetical protein
MILDFPDFARFFNVRYRTKPHDRLRSIFNRTSYNLCRIVLLLVRDAVSEIACVYRASHLCIRLCLATAYLKRTSTGFGNVTRDVFVDVDVDRYACHTITSLPLS